MKFFKFKKTKNALLKIADVYSENTPIRTLIVTSIAGVSLYYPKWGVPLSGLDQFIVSRISELGAKRARILFDEMNKHGHLLTKEQLDEDDFIHASVSVLNAAFRTRRKKKIRLFARFFINSTRDKFYKTDEFEEFVAILDDLSMREFEILMQLKPFQDDSKGHPQNKETSEPTIIDAYWEQFEEKITLSLGISKGELSALLSRLNRTGLYKNNPPGFLNSPGGRGTLTPLFYKFIEKLMDNYKTE